MRIKFISLVILFGCFSITEAQETNYSNVMNTGNVHFALDLGHKIESGTCGISIDYFLMDRFSGFVSFGVGASSYNGLIFSIGAKYFQPIRNKHGIVLSCNYTFAGKYSDILGDDDSPNRVWIHTAQVDYFRTNLAYCILTDGLYLLFKVGYSFPLENINYNFAGPGVPSSKQIQQVENGLNKGIAFGFSMVTYLSAFQKKTNSKK